jgi:hypothetical protein
MWYDMQPTGPSTNYAQTETRYIPLRSSIGVSLCQLWLGLNNDMIEAIVGRYTRGRFVGQLRGAIAYEFCTHGGWIRNHGVQRRGMFGTPRLVNAFTKQTI